MIREADKTYSEVAEDVGLSVTSLSRRINGHLPITFEELDRIAVSTGSTLSEVVKRIEQRVKRDAA